MVNIVSMYDESGNALRPWAQAGFTCWAFDILNKNKPSEKFPLSGGVIHYIEADLTDPEWLENIISLGPKFLMGWSPCTEMAVSGSKHFEGKFRNNMFFQVEALALAKAIETVGNAVGCLWFAENPVSMLSSWWRKPDYTFDPYEYGGYLPEDDVHPRWPEYIKPRDAYPKKTCIWAGNGFQLPPKSPVPVAPGWSDQMTKLGGKSEKTKQIRSEGPRGFLQAVFEFYCDRVRNA